jgi:hypothetical protein
MPLFRGLTATFIRPGILFGRINLVSLKYLAVDGCAHDGTIDFGADLSRLGVGFYHFGAGDVPRRQEQHHPG